MNDFTGRTCLVTGGSGYLAHALMQRLDAENCRILCASRSTVPLQTPPARRVTYTYAMSDICDQKFWSETLVKVDYVFHFAAQTSVYVADRDPAADWQANVQPMLALLETCRERGWRPFVVFAGSATQYGLPERIPVDETQPDRPVSIYDRHKIAAEAYLEHYARQGWARGTTLRLANVYGPGPVSSKADRGVLNAMARRALRGEALTFYGEGAQVRDYVFVTDVVEAFLAAAAHADRTNGRHFLVGRGEGHTLRQAFQLVSERAARLTGRAVPVVSVQPPAGLSPIEDRSFIADPSALRAATGWTARVPLPEGIDLTLASMHIPNPTTS